MEVTDQGYKVLIEKRLTLPRYQHSVNVARVARELAIRFHMDQESIDRAYLAGLLHDYARELPATELLQIAQAQGLIQDTVEELQPDLLHGVVGAYQLEAEGIVTDPIVLNAIRYHTTGHPDLDAVGRLIYISDYIEPLRDFPGVQELRVIAFKNLNHGVLAGLDQTIRHLLDRKRLLHPLSIETRNRLLEEIMMQASN